jgi:hypothetical protein
VFSDASPYLSMSTLIAIRVDRALFSINILKTDLYQIENVLILDNNKSQRNSNTNCVDQSQ